MFGFLKKPNATEKLLENLTNYQNKVHKLNNKVYFMENLISLYEKQLNVKTEIEEYNNGERYTCKIIPTDDSEKQIRFFYDTIKQNTRKT